MTLKVLAPSPSWWVGLSPELFYLKAHERATVLRNTPRGPLDGVGAQLMRAGWFLETAIKVQRKPY